MNNIKIDFKLIRGDFSLEINITLPSQGITALFGPSGSGKTTLLRSIAGLEHNCFGTITFNNYVWQNKDNNIFVPTHKRAVGYVFQEPSLFPHLSVKRNILYAYKRRQMHKKNYMSLNNIIALLDLQKLLKRKPNMLSGGEQKRIAIARALATNPNILLMDEPLSALDYNRKAQILSYIQTLHEKLQIPILYVTHSKEEVKKLAHFIIRLEDGHVKHFGKFKLSHI